MESLIPITVKDEINAAIQYAGSITEIKIITEKQYINAADEIKAIQGMLKSLEEKRKELKDPYFQKGKQIDSAFDGPKTNLNNAKAKFDIAMREYKQEQIRKAREEQAKLDAIAEEKRRKAEEAARKEREKAEKYAEQGREDLAAKAEVRAMEKENIAETIVAPVVQTEVPKVSGITTRANWKGEIIDPHKFIRWAVDQKRYEFLLPNQKAIDSYAKMTRQNYDFPGLRIYNDEKIVGSR